MNIFITKNRFKDFELTALKEIKNNFLLKKQLKKGRRRALKGYKSYYLEETSSSWIDTVTGNSWSKFKYKTKQDAFIAMKSNIGCTNCEDCADCINCQNAISSHDCYKISNCNRCNGCSNLTNSHDCKNCHNSANLFNEVDIDPNITVITQDDITYWKNNNGKLWDCKKYPILGNVIRLSNSIADEEV